MTERQTPLLDELEKGPWPSFVKEIKKSRKNPMAEDLLGILERSYREKIGHWKHGGIVGVMGYGGGVIGRYTDIPEDFPNVAHFHTIRVNQPAGWFYTSDVLRKICDIWERRGSNITNMHGSTGDMVLLGTTTDQLEPIFSELTELGFDLGGSGSDLRTPSCCNGQARCEWACYDTMGACYAITQEYQDELHRPAFPYKYKNKFAGCPNDCVASVARSDLSIIGTWKDSIQIDQAAIKAHHSDINMVDDVTSRCPTGCMKWDGAKLSIDNANCVKCMHCINVLNRALAPGKERGATFLLGAKAPIVGGALLASVMVPFVPADEVVDTIKELNEAIWDDWGENGKNRERVGEYIQRIGMGNFLERIGLAPVPQMVIHPRTNPYIFFEASEEE
ncbi:MAG: sulfite reductase, dissimilatory-type subunit alpha [Deltaproteobacteria bacterium RIFOXYA12_FULL_58_15]|nr:MAG: sulfite reductase, dissimilatory-type subunit alpha [Deltaproteobacteria bacterium RIFOXYA12_FULL_58_15]OGR12564.1 MAG: sulfite reductase, dissimilatory-type subunit alpha [Deltaproteobacteria bacterium RIFOXYB12_FULL_58_9]